MNDKKIINLLLEFSQSDLNTMPEEGRQIFNLKLSFLYRNMFRELKRKKSKDPGPAIFTDQSIQNIQKRLMEFFGKVEKLKPGFSVPIPGTRSNIIELEPIKRIMDLSRDGILELKNEGDCFDFKDAPQILENYVAELLSGFPKSSFYRCKECGKLFFSSSKKENKYCSSTCSWKFLSRERREAIKSNPKKYEAFKKKQRRYYRERKKSEQKKGGVT